MSRRMRPASRPWVTILKGALPSHSLPVASEGSGESIAWPRDRGIFFANCRFRVFEVDREIVNLVDQKRSRITLKEALTKWISGKQLIIPTK